MSNTKTASPRSRRARIVRTALLVVAAALTLPAAALAVFGWPASRHPTEPARMGVARSSREMEAVMDQPGPVTVETVAGADWQVERAGLINLDHPRARAAGLAGGLEPIQVFFHAIHHPTRGLFLVDTGVARSQFADPDHALVHGVVANLAHGDLMHPRTDTATWLATQHEPLSGVFLTHLHLDHVMGLPDVAASVPVYAGPGETSEREAMAVVTEPIIDRALEGRGALREWQFGNDPTGTFAGVLDVFGDGTVWAISVPGHTPGSTAYLLRTPTGPVLLVGDACHTAWGWNNAVEPGVFSHDRAQGAESLAKLRALVARHPGVEVRLGHQAL